MSLNYLPNDSDSSGELLGRVALETAASFVAVAFAYFGVATAAALSVVGVTSDNGLPARSVQWTDEAGQARTAIMVDQSAQGAGYLRRLTYQVNGGSRVCTGTGDNGNQGDGYVQNHTAYGGDSSSHGTPGTTTVVLAGIHHAIISYNMPNYQLDGHTVPTTVQWFFADGRSHPIYALSQDTTATAGNLGADCRSPYSDVAYDGGAGTTVGGASFGDTYKFTTLAAAPEQVTRASGWRYNEANTIPYVMQWSDPTQADAEMGHVATLPISVKDQGSDPRTFPVVDVRNTQQLNGPMIDDENWAYQILNYVLPANGPTGSKRLTWGSNWGLPGGFDNYGDNSLNVRQYSQHATSTLGHAYNGTRADGMLLAYSVFVVLGTHTGGYLNGTVGQAVKQMENAAMASLSASTGTVRISGPAGVGNAASTTASYTPAGYNGIYSTWEIVASGNAVNATLTPAATKSLDHPVFVINGYTLGQLPATISVGNGLVTPDVDYFATLDAANQRLWITVNRSASSAVNLIVTASGGAQQPSISSIPASGPVGASIIITGNNFSGVTAVTFNGTAAAFTVDSLTQITAVVPAGATAGTIAVTTSGGTAQSATTFTVLAAPANLPIYVDSLLNGFEDWSWATSVNYTNTSPVYSGSYSIGVTAGQWTALWLYHASFNTAPYTSLSFWINGGAAGAPGLQVTGVATNNYQALYDLPALAANTWTQFSLPLAALGVANITNCEGFWFYATHSGATTFYVDSIQLNNVTPPSLTVVPPTPKSGSFVLQLSGIPGQTYWIETSTNLVTWSSVSTNVLVAASVTITNQVIATSSHQFWRAVWPQ